MVLQEYRIEDELMLASGRAHEQTEGFGRKSEALLQSLMERSDEDADADGESDAEQEQPRRHRSAEKLFTGQSAQHGGLLSPGTDGARKRRSPEGHGLR